MSTTGEFSPLKDLISLSQKGAVVTGGARGIGLGICYRLAEAGAKVTIADVDTEAGEAAVKALRDREYQVTFVRCDVTREDEVKRMVETASREMGTLDVLVNNAGIYPRKALAEMTAQDFERVISVNLTGTFLCSRYASQKMIEQKRGGCIINIASIEAVHPSAAGMSAYDASKGGVLMLTKSLARELGWHSIRVNAIAPGAMLTRGVFSQLRKQPEEEKTQLKELKDFMRRIALGRMGEADDVARVALFLASELAGYITGDLIVVDGGYLIS